ncbi:Low-density lipoprotein receptor-related protein [Sergentomyia squamirostris]
MGSTMIRWMFLLLSLTAGASADAPTGAINLLFTTYQDIRWANVTDREIHIEVLTKDLVEGAAIDFHAARKLICWADQGRERVECMKMNGMKPVRKDIVVAAKAKVDGLAIDWLTEKIYWTVSETNKIEVVTLDGRWRKVLFWQDVDQPRGVAVVPARKLLVWTDWGESPKIESSSMDGDPTSRKVLVKDKSIFWPNGLAVDLERELIYWVDGKLHLLQVMRLDGSDRKTLATNLIYPYSLTMLHEHIFWTDWQLYAINTLSSSGEVRELFNVSVSPISVRIWDERIQPPGESACQTNNGDCSHLCLLAQNPQGFSCACPTGIRLVNTTTCADHATDMLFLVQRTQISRISLDTPDFTSFPLMLNRVKYAIAIDYDPVEDTVYWSDGDVHTIRRVRQDGQGAVETIVSAIAHADGLALDWLARNLYWTDTGMDRIEVSRMDGTSRFVVINENLKEPRAIAVAPTLGWMFWSDWNEEMPKIERAALDGSERVVLVSNDLGWPNGLALDFSENTVFWCDAKTDKIEVVGMNGSNRRVILSEQLPHVFGLSLLGDYIYWSDWQRRSIERAHKKEGTDRLVIVDQHPDLMGLKVARLREVNGSSPCAIDNGGCTHLCFNRPHDYVCRCPINYELAADRRTCYIPSAYLFFSRMRGLGRISVERNEGNYNDQVTPYKVIREVHALDVDDADGMLFWTDRRSKSIQRCLVNGTDVQKILDSGLGRPEAIAVDWLGRNVFWTDTELRRIEVARWDGSSRKVLVWRSVEEPKHLVVEPRRGVMYWTEQQLEVIQKAGMDGSEVVTIARKVGNVNGLALDEATRRLYWTSQSTPARIEWADCDGQRKGSTLIDLHGSDPFAIAVYGDFVYWSDWKTGDVERIHKISGLNRTLIHENLEFVRTLALYHTSPPTPTSGVNRCHVNNGGCSHLCLANRNGSACACPTHYFLNSDRVSCSPPRDYLIFSQKSTFGRLFPNSTDVLDASFPVTGKHIRVIEFDPVMKFLYWIDGKAVRKSAENGTKMSTVVSSGSQPFDMAIDFIGRLLYWTCSYTNSINISSLNGNSVGTIDTGDSTVPRNLAIDSVERQLFWTDYGQQAIFRAKVDGTSKVRLVHKLSGVTALTIDPQSKIVFYADGERIERIDYNGGSKQTITLLNYNQVTSLAALQNVLYWLDDKMLLESLTYNGERATNDGAVLQQLTDIVAVWTLPEGIVVNHTCTHLLKECSHLCVATGQASSTRHATLVEDACSCPHGLMLMEDKMSCGTLPPCGPDHFTCTSLMPGGLLDGVNKDCIPMSWRCDGQNDCMDKSDEMDCPSCSGDQFRCQSGECIDRKFVCDGTTHCADGHDEADCCKQPQDFQCPGNKVCIPPASLCDGWDHCADGADESSEVCGPTNNKRFVQTSDKKTFIIVIVILMLVTFFAAYVLQICRSRIMSHSTQMQNDPATAPLSPQAAGKITRGSRLSSVADAVWMSTLNGRTGSANSYDRNNITGASSSTTKGSNSLMAYPLNPPPSPATTNASTRHSGYRPYRHYKSINQPPPPTPCSTDVCDESDSNCTSKTASGRVQLSRRSHRTYADGGEPYPPPPTPRSHSDAGGYVLNESCPPSPAGSRSSAYFSPLPPPPSPVQSPRRDYS